MTWQACASFREGGGTGADTQLQSFVAMWECGPSVARSSFFFFFFQKKPEIWNFMRNLPIFKSWQLIQNIFKTLYGPKKKKKEKKSASYDCDLFGKSQKVFVIYLALCSIHLDFLPFPKHAMYFEPLFNMGLAARNALLLLHLETPTHPSGPSPNITFPGEVHIPCTRRSLQTREGSLTSLPWHPEQGLAHSRRSVNVC